MHSTPYILLKIQMKAAWCRAREVWRSSSMAGGLAGWLVGLAQAPMKRRVLYLIILIVSKMIDEDLQI